MILLRNATYIDWKTLEFVKTNIIVEEGKDCRICFTRLDKPVHTGNVIDCEGKIVTKSFAVGHHHVYSALSRGMGAPKKNPENFQEILKYIWWTLDKCLDLEMIEYSALTTAIACAKAGSTFVIDHHASPYAVKGSLGKIAKAFDKVGVSHLLCYEISDRDGSEIAGKGIEETKEYLAKNQGLVGLHASFTVGDETLANAVELMKTFNSGIHIHVAEDVYDQEQCEKTHNKRVVQRLYDSGVLNSSKTILGHCLHLSDHERSMIGSSPCWVVQNMESNLNNMVGMFTGKGIGKNIMLGTDGMHSDMMQSAKSAFFAGRKYDDIDYESAYTRFRNVHNYINSNGFKGDGDNNLVVIDYDSPTEFSKNNFFGHFLFGMNSNHIRHVISDGRLIVKDRRIQTVNEEEILKTARKLSMVLWEKMQA